MFPLSPQPSPPATFLSHLSPLLQLPKSENSPELPPPPRIVFLRWRRERKSTPVLENFLLRPKSPPPPTPSCVLLAATTATIHSSRQISWRPQTACSRPAFLPERQHAGTTWPAPGHPLVLVPLLRPALPVCSSSPAILPLLAPGGDAGPRAGPAWITARRGMHCERALRACDGQSPGAADWDPGGPSSASACAPGHARAPAQRW